MSMADDFNTPKRSMADDFNTPKRSMADDFNTPKPKPQPNNPRNGLSKSQIAEAEGNKSTAVGSFLQGGAIALNEYGATINKFADKATDFIAGQDTHFFDGGQKYWDDKRKMNEIETEDHEYSRLAGEMILDPINLTPAGVFGKATKVKKIANTIKGTKQIAKNMKVLSGQGVVNKTLSKVGLGKKTFPIDIKQQALLAETLGSKARRVGSSMVAGAGVGYATSKAKNFGNTSLTDEQKTEQDVMSMGIVTALNGVIAGLTKGKVTNAIKDVAHLKGEGKATAEEAINGVINNPKDFGFTPEEATKLSEDYSKIIKPTETPPMKVPPQEPTVSDNIFDHPRAKEAIGMARDRYASQTYNARVGGGSAVWQNPDGTYSRAGAKGEKNYHEGFILSKADIKKIDNGKITSEIEQKLWDDIDRLENDPNWNNETSTSKNLSDDMEFQKTEQEMLDANGGATMFTNAQHNLAGGFGAGTVNAGNGVFDENDTPDKMADRFIQGMVAGTLGVSGLKMLRKTNPQAFKRVQSWVMDNNVKVGDKMPTDGVQLGVFAGKKAKGFDGKPTHAGKYDNQQRFEIDDSKMEVINDGVTALSRKGYTNLDTIIKHDELFDNYPQLRNVIVKFDKNMEAHANFDGEGVITLSNKFKNKDEMSSSIIHEIQHWVQNKEGFAGGGNFDDMVMRVDGQIDDLVRKSEMSALDAMNYKKDLDYLKDNRSKEAFEKYKNIAGEIEAREVQARKNLTAQERELIPNYENVDTMGAGHSDEAYNEAFMAKLDGRHGDFDSTGIHPDDASLDFSRSKAEMSPVKSKSQRNTRGAYNVLHNDKQSAEIGRGISDKTLLLEKGEHWYKNDEIYGYGLSKNIEKHVKKQKDLTPDDIIHTPKAMEQSDTYINRGNLVFDFPSKDNAKFRIVFTKKIDKNRNVVLDNNGKEIWTNVSMFRKGKGGRLESLHNQLSKETGSQSGEFSALQSSSNKSSIPQTPKNPNMRDGFVKLPESNEKFFKHNFDNLETKAKAEMDKDWKDLSQSNGTLKNLWNGLNYFMRDSMSGKYHEIRDITHANLQKSDGELANLGRVLGELDETTDTNLFSYLVKENDGKNLPENVKKMGDMIRYTIDRKSRILVDKGLLAKEDMDEWIGAYLYRMYEPTMAKKVGGGISGKFKMDKNFERGDPKDFKKDDIKGISGWLNKNGFLDDGDLQKLNTIEDVQKHLEDTDSLGMLREGKLKLTDLGDSIRIKRDWTRTERDTMGEVRSAKITVLETLARMNKLEQHAEFLERAAKTDGVVADKMLVKNLSPMELNRKGFYKLEKSAQLGAMSGKWVRRDVADDITRTTKDVMHIHDEWFNVWNAGHGLWKKSKTVWNPTAHANNFAGNVFLMHLAGVNGFRVGGVLNNGRKAMVALKKIEDLEYKGLTGRLSQSEVGELKELKNVGKFAIEAKQNGIFGRSQLNDILAGLEQNTQGGGIFKKVDRFLSKAYQAEDNFNRLSFYLTLRESGKDAKTAKKMVDFMLPDYTKPLPKGFRVLRDSSIAPFISWSYYTMPSIIKMMATKRGGMKVATVLGLLSTMEYFASNGEITPLDNVPDFLGGTNNKPEDFKGRRFVYGKDGDEYKTIKLDRMIPYAELQSLPNYVNGLLSGILPNLAYTSRGKQLYGGRPITYENKSGGDKAIDWIKHLASQYTPIPVPAMNAVNAVDSAVRSKKKRKRNEVLVPRNSAQDILKNVGINTMSYSKRALEKDQRKK